MSKLTYEELHRFYCEAKRIDQNIESGIVAPDTLWYWIHHRGLTPEAAARTLLTPPIKDTA